MIRSDHMNERYYALTNAPTFRQFIGKYHFVDKLGRQYMIATKNDQIFQNERVQFKNKSSRLKEDKKVECVKDSFNFIKFFVKLPDSNVKWFGSNDIDKSFELYYVQRTSGDKSKSKESYDREKPFIIQIKYTEKPLYNRSTGIVFIKGLSIETCNTLLMYNHK